MDRIKIALIIIFILTACTALAQISTSGILTKDTTWSGTVNVLGDLIVPEGITLTIEPGTVVRFAARSDQQSSGDNATLTEFIVKGMLIAKGTTNSMITFTSELSTNPQPEDWMGIWFGPDSSKSVISYSIVEYGNTGIYCKFGSPTITNNIIRNNSPWQGILLWGGSAYVAGNTLTENKAEGLRLVEGTSLIENNIITRNSGSGVVCSGREGSTTPSKIINNIITNNAEYGVDLIKYANTQLGNTSNVDTKDDGGNYIHGNGKYDIHNDTPSTIKAEGNYWGTNNPVIIDRNIYDDEEDGRLGSIDFEPWLSAPEGSLTYLNTALAYYTRSGIITKNEIWSGIVRVLGDVTVPEGVTLTIEPGTIVRFAARSDSESGGRYPVSTEFTVCGVLIAKGTPENMITFTSELTENPQPGDWYGITFRDHPAKTHTVDSVIDYCIIEYGHEGVNCGSGSYQPSPNVTNSIIRKNSDNGMYLGSYFSVIQGNTITDNKNCGVYIGCSAPTIRQNKLMRNKRGLAMHSCGATPKWWVTDNLITENWEYGIYISNSQPPLGNVSNTDPDDDGGNHIYTNGKYDVYNTSPTIIRAEGNYWGTSDPAEIDSHIWDNEEGVTRNSDNTEVIPGIVDFDPWLSAPDGSLTGLITLTLKTSQMVNIGDTFSATISIDNVSDLAGFQMNVSYDPAVLSVVKVEDGTFLSSGGSTYWQTPSIDDAKGVITNIACGRTSKGGVDGSGILATITFKSIHAGKSSVNMQNIILSDSNGKKITFVSHDTSVNVAEIQPCDVNKDGRVDVLDIVLIGQHFGETGNIPEDVNGDGTVDILDLVLVGQHFGENYLPAAPSMNLWAVEQQYLPVLTMLYDAVGHSNDPGIISTRELLYRLISSVVVSKTVVFQNYPNPFNPETWIPYQLSVDSDLVINIYSASGNLIRTLNFGYQPTGFYTTKDKAAYWDGKNEAGEQTASGIYFYSIHAGDFTATKKMVITR